MVWAGHRDKCEDGGGSELMLLEMVGCESGEETGAASASVLFCRISER